MKMKAGNSLHLALGAVLFVLAGGAGASPPKLPPAADFASDITSGRLDPEAFDFAAHGFWSLPQPDRAMWFSLVVQALMPAQPAVNGCALESQRRFVGTIWTMMANQATDAADWQLNARALRARLAALDVKVAEAGATAPNDDPRIRELLARVARDQRVRHVYTEPEWTQNLPLIAATNWFAVFGPRMTTIDCDNTAWLKQQLARVGWFDIPTYGAAADSAAWTLVQHADLTPEFQREMLPKLQALPKGHTEPRRLAMLHDRIARAENKPQRYGTQGRCEPDGTWKPYESEDPEHLDERRAALGMKPIAEHAKDVWLSACPKTTAP